MVADLVRADVEPAPSPTCESLPPSVKNRNDRDKLKSNPLIVKGQRNEILIRLESRHSSRPDVFYFLSSTHFLKQLLTRIAHIAKATQASAETKSLSKSAILLTRKWGILFIFVF